MGWGQPPIPSDEKQHGYHPSLWDLSSKKAPPHTVGASPNIIPSRLTEGAPANGAPELVLTPGIPAPGKIPQKSRENTVHTLSVSLANSLGHHYAFSSSTHREIRGNAPQE